MKASKGLFLVLASILSLCVVNTQSVKSQPFEFIYIASDGSIYSSNNVSVPIQRVGEVYTFNGTIVDYSIVILRDNIVVDGAGNTLQGEGEIGIDLSGRSNVTISNIQISGFLFSGIYLWNSSSNTITGNTIAYNMGGITAQEALDNTISANNITNNFEGILLDGSSDNNVYGNTITNNGRGISFYSSSYNTLRNNSFNNSYNFAVFGTELSHFVNDVDVSNIINGKKVYYFVNERDLVISPATFSDSGFLVLVNCANITIQNLELADNGQGILLAFTTDSTIIQNTITNNNNGVELYSSSYNFISENCITNNYRGIQLSNSSISNRISTNNITNNGDGISLFESSQNTINGNNITKNEIGIGFSASSYNMIYHNYFISNIRQVYDSYMSDSSGASSVNNWDFGYPLGGNYWSDYAGVDVKGGSNQNQLGSDGIGDTPYIIYENNNDSYPLMPYGSPPAVFIFSPENKTYTVKDVSLTFAVSETASWIGYSLDGKANTTIAENTTLPGLSDGSHRLVVYIRDIDGNAGAPETIYFTIAQESEPFQITWIIAATTIIAIGGVAFLVYFKKIKKPTRKVRTQPPIPPATKEVPRPKKATPKTITAIYCIHCGEGLPPHAVYCRKCGNKVE